LFRLAFEDDFVIFEANSLLSHVMLRTEDILGQEYDAWQEKHALPITVSFDYILLLHATLLWCKCPNCQVKGELTGDEPD